MKKRPTRTKDNHPEEDRRTLYKYNTKQRDVQRRTNKTWDQSLEERTMQTNNTRQLEEERKAVQPACNIGCLDLYSRHHKVVPVQ